MKRRNAAAKDAFAPAQDELSVRSDGRIPDGRAFTANNTANATRYTPIAIANGRGQTMSRNIEVDAVTSVLLADGKWHNVQDQSFHTASYEFHSKGESGHGGGQGGVWPTGFSFKSGGEVLYGPLAAIVAVKTKAHE